jgi:hypothetical protein
MNEAKGKRRNKLAGAKDTEKTKRKQKGSAKEAKE